MSLYIYNISVFSRLALGFGLFLILFLSFPLCPVHRLALFGGHKTRELIDLHKLRVFVAETAIEG